MDGDEAVVLDRLVATMLNGETPDGLTTTEAARWFRVDESTVRSWARRGHLKVTGQRDRQNIYRFADLVAADRRTRNSPNLRTPRRDD